MRVYIIAVGEKSPPWVEAGIREYLKRISHEVQIKIISVPVSKRTKSKTTRQLQLSEQEFLIKHTPKRTFRIALDEHGQPCSTGLLSEKLNEWMQHTPIITIYVGGPDGFTSEFLNNVDLVWSISSMTLPHMLVRVLLVEQLYRAWTITKSHPYHRE